MSNYLVILAGSPRGGKKTWKYIFKYVVDHLDADLAVLTTENYITNNILFEKADYIWSVKNYENFFEYYESEFSGNWKEYFIKGKGTGLYESGVIHFAFKDIVLKKYKNILANYEYIIYSRFDQMYIDYHTSLSSEELKIQIPEGEDYFGICDRHAAFNTELSQQYLNICAYVDSGNIPKNNYLNCEVTMMNQFEYFNINQYVDRNKRYQFTTATKNDKTNWRVPKYKIFLTSNLFLKYPDEFLDSIRNYIKKHGIVKSFIQHPVFVLYFQYLLFRQFIGKLFK